jgi:alkylhydroperoxidase/carboxymuconolactone decarboxylase family protein YurZ
MKLKFQAITSRLYRAWLRLWLRARLDTYTRHLQAIAAQRENDFHAERMLHRAVSATRAKLQSL